METRALGRTGLTVTRLGLGLAALGRPAYITLGREADFSDRSEAAMRARSEAVLDAAWDAGVRFFDTARSYGYAERFLGGWLRSRGVSPGGAAISSKWGYAYVGDWRMDADLHEHKQHDHPRFAAQITESRAEIGEWMGLYLIHSLTLESGALEDAALLGALAALKATGLPVGFSTSGPDQARTIDRAMEIRIDGAPLFDAVQATWNLRERAAGPALARAHAAGLGVVVKEGVANGLLTDRALADADAPWARALAGIAAEAGLGADALALAAILAQPWADAALSGAATVAQLRANLAAVDAPADAVAEALDGAPAQGAAEYWAARAALPWS